MYGTEHIRYLQGAGRIDDVPKGGAWSESPLLLRRLWNIHGVGVTEKFAKPQAQSNPSEQPHMPSLDMLMGLYGFKVPIAFSVRSQNETLSISMGTYLPSSQASVIGDPARVLGERNQIVKALLQASFRSISLSAGDPAISRPKAAGIVIGIPTVKSPDSADGSLPWDILARALSDTSWGVLVLAEPVLESKSAELRLKAVEELKGAQHHVKHLAYPDPLSEHYQTLINVTVDDYTFGDAVGIWRTNVYLYGNESDYARLGAVWQGIFSGPRSMHMPIKIARHSEIPDLVRDWKYSDEIGPEFGVFRHPYRYQAILNSEQLAAYVHLPHRETNGFSLSLVPSFDTMPRSWQSGDRQLSLGNVVSDWRITGTPFSVPLASLRSHVLVAGVTNSGKTYTMRSILKQVADENIPFLVIEPAKAEYRSLPVVSSRQKKLRIFTPGNERVSPLRLNPFEPIGGASVSVHLDLLRSAFNASFGMWNPLPQVLEQCLHAVYADRGWDLVSDRNTRADGGDSALAYPTLGDLIRKVDEITPTLGYDEKIASDVRAALRVRLGSLTTGGKGRMLNVRRSTPAAELFDGFTVVELQGMGDDDDKAFVMALLLIQSSEYLQSLGQTSELRHLLVIEEAHRLLTNVAQKSGEEGNPRAKAVESFTNLLSEIRWLGQGVIIIDQVPVRLAPDAIKNTNLKIVHRIVASDDRTALAGAMAMSQEQSAILASLDTGYAAVHSKGEDAPLLIKVAQLKEEFEERDDEALHAFMRPEDGPAPNHWNCAASIEKNYECELARSLAESESFQSDLSRMLMSLMETNDENVALGFWNVLRGHIARARRGSSDVGVITRCTVARASERIADEWGEHNGWTYSSVEQFASEVHSLLSGLIEGRADGISSFQEKAAQLHLRQYDPYSHCSIICPGEPSRCIYRNAAARISHSPSIRSRWVEASQLDISEGSRSRTWKVAMDAAYMMLDAPGSSAATKAGLCFSQQMLAADATILPQERAIGIENIIDAAQAAGDSQ